MKKIYILLRRKSLALIALFMFAGSLQAASIPTCSITKVNGSSCYSTTLTSVTLNSDNTYTIVLTVVNDGSPGPDCKELSHYSVQGIDKTYSNVSVNVLTGSMKYDHNIAMGPNLGASTPFEGFKIDNTSGIGDGHAGSFTVTYNLTYLQRQQTAAKAGNEFNVATFELADFQAVLNCSQPKVQNPTFNLETGTYTTCQTLSLGCPTAGANIYYTTDGTTPDTRCTLYSTPLNISSTTTVKAITIKAGLTNSDVVSRTYTINLQQVAKPTFSPLPGTFNVAQDVSISSTTAGAAIYYTTNGDTPTTSSTLYVSGTPVHIGATKTLKAIAVKECMINSDVASGTYEIIIIQKVVDPTFNLETGTYTTCQTVSLACSTEGAKIYYTTNGATPDASSTLYAAPLTFNSTTTIKAIAIKAGMTNSNVVSRTYTINLVQVAKPTFSPAPGTFNVAQDVSISSTTAGATIYYTTNGDTPTTSSTHYVSGTPVHIAVSTTLKAIAVKECMINSEVATGSYIITEENHNPFPATGFASVAFEDLWPAMGDYDMNDIVMDCKFDQISNSENKVTKITAQFVLRAMGASFHDGFGIQLPVTPDKVSSCVLKLDNGQPVPMAGLVTINSKGLEQGQDKAVVIIFDDGFNVLPQIYSGIGVNTTPGIPWTPTQTINMTLTFSEPIDENLLEAPYNPFIFADKKRGAEIHLPNNPPTSLADMSLFKTDDDNSNVATFGTSSVKSYTTAKNLPWAILFYKKYDYPIEKTPILSAFLHFSEWAQSGGQEFTDWYFNTANGYRDTNKIYIHQ